MIFPCLSSYGMFFNSGINLVTFYFYHSFHECFILNESLDRATLPNSMWALIRATNKFFSVSLCLCSYGLHVNISILFALLIWISICLKNFNSQFTFTPRYFSIMDSIPEVQITLMKPINIPISDWSMPYLLFYTLVVLTIYFCLILLHEALSITIIK